MNTFDDTKDYTRTGGVYDRENYVCYLKELTQEDLTKLLSDNIVGSKLKLSQWDKSNIAEHLAEIKFGKEEE